MGHQLTTIRLYGKLGSTYGRVHRLHLDSNTPGEAFEALCGQIRGFKQDLMTSAERGIKYAVFIGKKNIDENQLLDSVRGHDIRVAPVIVGSKQAGVLQTIIGAVLVVIGIATSWTGVGAYIGAAGISMMLGGVIQMLSPQQKGLSAKDSPDNGASYNFNGPVNTSAQGNPVPLLYGRMICGSAVISAGILADDKV